MMQTLFAIVLSGSLATFSFFGHSLQPIITFVDEHLPSSFGDGMGGNDENAPVPAATSTTPAETQQQPQNMTALGRYNVLIADRGNNRVIEVTPDKRIVWEYNFAHLKKGFGADDAFFADNGNTVMMSLENYNLIEQVDYATQKIEWQYGTPGVAGFRYGRLHTPDDAYKLANGNVVVADIQNCRVIEISPEGKIVRQYGVTRRCGTAPGLLDSPNGDTPLPNGGLLISEIKPHDIVELNKNWKEIARYPLPITYPSDPQPMQNGDILVANYRNPGALIELNPSTGKVVWQFSYTSGDRRLNRPSLAIEMPNGIILCNDDLNHRVIAIDKNTNQIVWQYGVTGKPGDGPGQLNIPDGISIIMRAPKTTSTPQSLHMPVYTIGYVMRHAAYFSNTMVEMHGYVLKDNGAYSIVSDEKNGAVTAGDLPIASTALEKLAPRTSYLFRGTLVKGGLTASNRNPYHLELANDPVPYP